jgi:glyoxylase-like metal-dependent hydrolase (beta-lactamase superfamily II)
MTLKIIHTGFFKLDGGAMFGVVPKKLWQRLNPPDENNLCTWSMRCLLIETDNRKILVDTGLGEKYTEFIKHFEPHGEKTLLKSLATEGVSPEDITDVFFTHLHFDHCGGATRYDESGRVEPVFSNAKHWTNKRHWDWAMNPNPREQASFLTENLIPLQENNLLYFIDIQHDIEFLPDIHIQFNYGHTEAMMLLKIKIKDKIFFYCADTIPSLWHINLPYIMAYDVRPLDTLKEKTHILEQAERENCYLIFEHDPTLECATIKKDERGRYSSDNSFKISEII